MPSELKGQLNLVIFGFAKHQMTKEMFSWYPIGRAMAIELAKKSQRLREMHEREEGGSNRNVNNNEEDKEAKEDRSHDSDKQGNKETKDGNAPSISSASKLTVSDNDSAASERTESSSYCSGGGDSSNDRDSHPANPQAEPAEPFSATMECYTLFLYPRWYRVFHPFIQWRYKHLLKAYGVNKIKVRETKKLQMLSKQAGLKDLKRFHELDGRRWG